MLSSAISSGVSFPFVRLYANTIRYTKSKFLVLQLAGLFPDKCPCQSGINLRNMQRRVILSAKFCNGLSCIIFFSRSNACLVRLYLIYILFVINFFPEADIYILII